MDFNRAWFTRWSTAIRTATPFVTWSRITLLGPSATSGSIDPEVADGPRSVILDQVTNGVAVRMAVLHLVNQARLKSMGVGVATDSVREVGGA